MSNSLQHFIKTRLRKELPTHVVLATPMDMVEVEVSIDGKMSDRGERHTVLVVLELLLVNDDLETILLTLRSEQQTW